MTKKLLTSIFAISLLMFSGAANAATVMPVYNGVIDCNGDALCNAFGADGGALLITSTVIFPDGGGTLTDADLANFSDVVISIFTLGGQTLEFVDGSATAANLTFDSIGNVTNGTVAFTATGATTGFVAAGVIDVDAGTFVPFVNGNAVGSGMGSFQQVPVPAAAWLLGSALLGLFGVRRRA